MLYFTADYELKGELLRLGAKWDFSRWKWYIEERRDYEKFAPYLGGKLITDELYLLESTEICPYCGKKTKIAALAVGCYYENFLPEKLGEGYMNILYGFEKISGGIASLLRDKFPVKLRYYGVYGYKYLSNGCKNCDALYPDTYLFGENDSPFFADEKAKAERLNVYRLKTDGDVALDARVALSFKKPLFDGCNFEQLEIE